MSKIVFDAVDQGRVRITTSYLSGYEFNKFLDLNRQHEVQFDGAYNHIGVERLTPYIAAVRTAGFTPQLDAAIVGVLNAQADTLDAEAAAADENARQAAVEIAARGLALYPFQGDGARWMRERARADKNALLADQMGLGKTIQALAALPENAAVIVVCPASVKLNWRNEIRAWRPDLDPVVLRGKGTFRAPNAGQVVILNYDITPESPDRLTFLPGTTLIVDEAHMVKTRTAGRTIRVRMLTAALSAVKGPTWYLTGTPLLNYPTELWSVLDGLGVAHEAFGSVKRFKALFNSSGGKLQSVANDADKSEIARCLRRVMLMRLRADVMPQLPAKTRSDVPVEIDGDTVTLLDTTVAKLKELGIDFFGSRKFALDHADSEGEDGASANRVAFELISKARAALARAKIPAVVEMVGQYEDAQEPLVFFSCHRDPVDLIGAREGWAAITGDVSPERRQQIVERFQRGELRGIAATIQAGGVGLTLTRACNVLMSDLAWTPALNSQAEDRVCRIGQTRPVNVTRLVADHAVDRRLAELLTIKDDHVATVEQSAVAAVTASGSNAKRLAAAALRAITAKRGVAVEVAPAAAAPGALPKGHKAAVVNINGRDCRMVVREPENAVERHAGEALMTLAYLSPDGARIRNDVGFNGTDAEFGTSLATTFRMHGGLSPKQWTYAVKIVRKYHRQVGVAPAESVSA